MADDLDQARACAPGVIGPEASGQLALWLAQADIDAIEIDAPGMQLRLVRGAQGYQPEPAGDLVPSQPGGPAQASVALAHCAGIFLDRHPAADAGLAPAGAPVRAGDVVALLQIGLLLAPVLAPVGGVVGRLLVAPGTLVGYGTRLVEIVAGEP